MPLIKMIFASSKTRLAVLSLLLAASTLPTANGSCKILTKRCKFPFEDYGEKSFSCVKPRLPEYDDESVSNTTDDWFCKVDVGDREAWGKCNDSCLDDDGKNALTFESEDPNGGLSAFCHNVAVDCVFPFIYNGITYDECTSEDLNSTDSSLKWCATEVDGNGVMKEGKFGICDDSCFAPESTPEPPVEIPSSEAPEALVDPKTITIQIKSEDGVISGDITFSQESPDSKLKITGTISGLQEGRHGFHVHEKPDLTANCKYAGLHFNPANVVHGAHNDETRHIGDLGNIDADASGVAKFDIEVNDTSIFDGPNLIVGLPIVVHEMEDDLGRNADSEESLKTGSSGSRIACALIEEKAEEDNTLLIIIIVVVVIIVLLILAAILIYFCIKKRKSKVREKVPYDDPTFDYPNGDAVKKSPLYDELSIPFIDASPAPTPKTGRSTERLSFFNRTPSIGRSRGSLSMPPPYAPPPPPSIESSTTEISWRGSLRKFGNNNKKPARV